MPNNKQSFFPNNFTLGSNADCAAPNNHLIQKQKGNTKMNSPFSHQKVPGFPTLPSLIITSNKFQ